MADLDMLQATLGYRFRDPALLQLALTHPSVAHEQGGVTQHNQRLEFLGDAVLQLALTRALFDRFPLEDEGVLTKTRSQLVNQAALEAQSHALGMGDYLILSRAEEANGGRARASILADAFEAVLGAVYLDGGLGAAEELILLRYKELLSAGASRLNANPKGQLQEWLQAQSTEAPEYRQEEASGPDHDRTFICSVHHGGKELGRGSGKSKKLAEIEAARVALQQLRGAGAGEAGQKGPNHVA